MNNFKNKFDRQLVLYLWLLFFVLSSFDFICLIAWQNFYTISSFVLLVGITIFLTILVKKVSKNYKLKYYFNKKEYNKLFNESIKKFINPSDAFVKELKKRTYQSYCEDGVLYYSPNLEETKWLYRGEANKDGFLILVNLLINSIDNKGGFIWFIEQAKILTNNPYLNFITLYNPFLSGEIRYLIVMVYDLCEFDFTDNHMSLEYTESLKKIKDEIEKEYTPLLFNFKNELLGVADYFKESQQEIC